MDKKFDDYKLAALHLASKMIDVRAPSDFFDDEVRDLTIDRAIVSAMIVGEDAENQDYILLKAEEDAAHLIVGMSMQDKIEYILRNTAAALKVTADKLNSQLVEWCASVKT